MSLSGKKKKQADKSKPVSEKRGPYYLEIAEQLREELLKGDFEPGQRFYSIRDLIRRTNRSLPTVRSAINLLIEENLLSSRPGSGYYVTGRVSEHRFDSITQLLVVVPSYVLPNESIFTGKIVSGMIDAAEHRDTVVSVYRRKAVLPLRYDKEASDKDLENILAARPNAIAWLHVFPFDYPILKELKKQDIPIVTTIRKLPQIEFPMIREDDQIYAAIVLSQFQARGHRRIGVVLRDPENDEYFYSKISALRKMAASLNMSVDESDCFYFKSDMVNFEKDKAGLKNFLDERKDLNALLLLASSAIIPVAELMGASMCKRLSSMSIVLNVLDGVKIPALPSGDSLATITPPLEELGKRLCNLLLDRIAGKQFSEEAPLVLDFRSGASLKILNADHDPL